MAYDHSKKIGNEGDLVKHAVLHACVTQLFDEINAKDDSEFKYLETHCGRAVYVLPEHGDWKRGIGEFSNIGWTNLTKTEKESRSSLLPFFEEHLNPKMCSGQIYFGSSGIVFRILRQQSPHSGDFNRKSGFSFDLYDTDIHVYDDLLRHYDPFAKRVRVHCSDGFEAVKSLQTGNASLVLIDPPDREFGPVVDAIKHLKDARIPFICWTTRFSKQGEECEHSDCVKFVKSLPNVSHLSVRWMNPTGSNQSPFGCTLSLSKNFAQTSESVVDQLVSVMPEKPMAPPKKKRKNETEEAYEERQSLERVRKWERH